MYNCFVYDFTDSCDTVQISLQITNNMWQINIPKFLKIILEDPTK